MSHDNDTIRRIIREQDAQVEILNRMPRMPTERDAHNLQLATDAIEVARMRLQLIGHGSHFDTPDPIEGTHEIT